MLRSMNVFCAILALLIFATPCFAQVPCNGCGGIDNFVGALSELSGYYEQAAQNLKSKPESEWTEDEVLRFLAYSLAIAYHNYGIEYICNDHGIPTYLEEFPELLHITLWPENPYNDWKPVRLLSFPSEFSPGDIVIQTYDGMNQEAGATESYQLYIYGPTLDFTTIQLYILNDNQEWATPPVGAVLAMGTHVETESERQRRVEYFRQLRESSTDNDPS